MAIVTNSLVNTLRQQVQKHGTVIWYDPEEAYSETIANLDPDAVSDATVAGYDPDSGFLALRRELDPLWNENGPPKLIVYVPLARQESKDALIEFEVAGAILQPGQQPPEQNTSLANVARHALPQVFPPAKVEALVAQVEAGQLNLAELDNLAEKGLEGQSGVIAAIFGTGNANEVTLLFLAKASFDKEIKERGATGSVATLLNEALGVTFSAEQGLAAMRAQAARLILLTDFVVALADEAPEKLRTFKMAERPAAQEAAAALAQDWRNRLDGAQSYCEFSSRVEGESGLRSLHLPIKALARSETFKGAERMLQAAVEEALRQQDTAAMVSLAEERLGGFWSRQDPLVKTRWEVILAAGQVLLASRRVNSGLRGKQWTAEALVGRYAYEEGDREPWCALDAAQRHLERDFHRFEFDPQRHQTLMQLVSHARQRYADTTGKLAERFIRAYDDAKFELEALTAQTDIYKEAVEPASAKEQVAYLLVDALRYEMARELLTVLEEEWTADLRPALATPPTITEYGMAALMPGAEKGLAIEAGAGGKLAPIVDEKALRTRQERVKHFEATTTVPSVTVKLDQLAPLASPKLGKELERAKLILVTATEEIDGLCETNPALARRMMDDVLNQLRRGVKTLFGVGVDRVVITADHGYLFGEEISSGQTIDPPGGETGILKRRVWVGKGGAQIPGTLRRPLSAFGIGGDFELVTPITLGIFKVAGGSTSYFHGGLSLPEVVIPVLSIRSGAAPTDDAGAMIAWKLALGSQRISTRFLSVTVEGASIGLLPAVAPAVRVEVRADDDILSVPISATYGFEEATKDVQLKANEEDVRAIVSNTVTLQITDEANVGSVAIHLLDAGSGISLARIDKVPFEISF